MTAVAFRTAHDAAKASRIAPGGVTKLVLYKISITFKDSLREVFYTAFGVKSKEKIMDMKKVETNKNFEQPECNHPVTVREYAYGGPTGNFICTQCERLLSSAGRGQAQQITFGGLRPG